MDSTPILKKLDQIENISTLPVIIRKVNNMLQDSNASIRDISDIIEKDQSITFKILKLVNSSFYGVRSNIGNVSHALILLGFKTVRNTFLSVWIIDVFSTNDVLNGVDILDFWKHSVSVAVISKYLAEKTHLYDPDDCFVGGLLHDIGKIVLVKHFPKIFKEIWILVQREGLPFYHAEKVKMTMNHAKIGGYLAEKWQLPANLIDAIQHHHSEDEIVPNGNLPLIVHAANKIANRCVIDSTSKYSMHETSFDAAKLLERQISNWSDWFPEVSKEIEAACESFL